MSAYDFDLRSNCLPDSVSLKVIYYSGLHAQISEWICTVSESASLVAQLVKNLPAMWETWVWSLGWEDPLEKGKATYPLQYSGLDNSMDYTVHGVAKILTRLSDSFIYSYISYIPI